MRKTNTIALLLGMALLFAGTAWADDDDIFTQDVVEPNVVILLDSSGSMADHINGDDKMDIAEDTIISMINNVEGVRFGVMRFNGAANGGMMVAAVGTDKATMSNEINSIKPNGSTPLGRATQDLQDYYSGTFTGWTCTGSCDGFHIADQDEGDDEGYDSTVEITYPSPIEEECQKNYAILVTDGLPNGEAQDLVSDVASSLFTTDHDTTLDGIQNVIVHTVGFDVPAGTALLTQTAANGGGNFYTASNAAQLEAALQEALLEILEDSYSFAAPVIPSTSVTGGTLGYFASFEPNPVAPFWEGQLKAYTRGSDGKVPTDSDGMPDPAALAWDAGALLDARTPASRTIYTAIGGTRHNFLASNGALNNTVMGVSSESLADDVINFTRGVDSFDTDADGNDTEARDWKLGDIFHSTPVLVFPPPLSSPDSDYDNFKSTYANRETVLLVGANDGMLHAFRASDGVELWGFVPPDLLNDLRGLTNRFGQHRYFVDSTPVVADVKTGGAWKTIALFGLRRGGGSYHALDISNTANPTYLWSFTDAEIDESWSVPQIGKIKLNDGSDRWVAFVGGGYDTPANNSSGRGLFAIDLATGNKIWEYRGGIAGDKQFMHFSVPATPTAVDLNSDGYIDRVYVGDVGGQIWKFDTSNAATFSGSLINNWTGKRLFAALPSATVPPPAGTYVAPQAIYGSPTLSYDDQGDLWVFFGTGDRNNPKSTSSNFFYAVKDDTDMTNGSALNPSSLVDVSSGSSVTQGWYFALGSNEKVLSKADVFNEMVLFTSYTPDLADVCEAGIGESDLYAVRLPDGLPALDWITGDPLASPDGSEPSSIDAGDGIASDPDVILGTDTDTIVVGTTDGALEEVDMDAERTKEVRYWREVL